MQKTDGMEKHYHDVLVRFGERVMNVAQSVVHNPGSFASDSHLPMVRPSSADFTTGQPCFP